MCNAPPAEPLAYKTARRLGSPELTIPPGKDKTTTTKPPPSIQMEGLIPFIYKAIKERRTRGYSRCSSTGGSAAHVRFGVGVARVEDMGGDDWDQKRWEAGGGGGKVAAEREMAAAHHHRHRSLEELAGEVGGALPRGGSVRIFSCISGM